MVPAPAHGLGLLPRSGALLTIGDRFFAVHPGEDGGGVITEAGIVGQEQSPSARLRLSEFFAAGSPLLDDRGDLVGLAMGERRKISGRSRCRWTTRGCG